MTTDAHVTNVPESERGYTALARRGGPGDPATEPVVVRSARYTVDDPEFTVVVRRLARDAAGSIAFARLYTETRDASLVSPDRHALLIPIGLTTPREPALERLLAVIGDTNERGDAEVAMTGEFTQEHDLQRVSQEDLAKGEFIGMPAALLVLLLVFGTVVAASLPLLLAVVAIIVRLGLAALIGSAWEISFFMVNMLTGMGLALGIDYALFIVSRFREEHARGLDTTEAIATAGATASRAVLFSGSAFVLAMVGLLLVQSTIMRSLAIGAIVVAIGSVVAALTLLPAVLSLLGDRVNRFRIPLIARDSGGESRFWGRIVGRVVRRPGLSLALSVAVLLLAASPVLGMHIGASGISTLPDKLESKQGVLALQHSFPAAGAEPAFVVVDGGVRDKTVREGITQLRAAVRADRSFGSPQVQVDEAADLAVVTVQISADPLSDRAVSAVRRLRADLVPAAFGAEAGRVLVTGTTAENVDYFDVMGFWLPIVIAFVLVLSFGLLTLAFRSVVVAATAIGVTLLSVGAAYGLLVLVFQHGVGADLLGFTQVETIEAWVPLFLFAVLFGLSMDYQVFLLSRIRERHLEPGDTTEAVTFGITSTARLITGLTATSGGPRSTPRCGIQSSHRGRYQFQPPSSTIAAGTSTERTIVASSMSAMAIPNPICWNITRSPWAKPTKTVTMISAAPGLLRTLGATLCRGRESPRELSRADRLVPSPRAHGATRPASVTSNKVQRALEHP